MSSPSTKVKASSRGGGDASYQGAMRVLAQGLGERLEVSPVLVFSCVGSEVRRGLGGPLAENLPWLTFDCTLFC